MKHISEIPLRGALAAAQPAPARQVVMSEESSKVVNALFRELKAIFPAWRNAWPQPEDEAAARQSWIKAFTAANLRNLDQIRYGVERCRMSAKPYMPSVGEFIQWCKPSPEVLGCPDVRTAYRMACRLAHPTADREGVHPAVWHAACETGLHELRELPERDSRPLFERNYGLTLGMVERGQPLREIPKALPEAVSVPSTKEHARSCLAQMRQGLLGAATA